MGLYVSLMGVYGAVCATYGAVCATYGSLWVRDYAAVVFLAHGRYETGKRRLHFLSFLSLMGRYGALCGTAGALWGSVWH